jgi:hypothetical protein
MTRTALFQTALSGLVAGTLAACGGSETTAPATDEAAVTEPAPAPAEPMTATATEGAQPAALPAHECKGHNECSGQGGCKVEGQNDCRGKNPCKGKGGCKTA